MSEKHYPTAFIKLKEQLGDGVEDGKIIKSELSSIPIPFIESGGVFSPETRPRKWQAPKTLKTLIMESDDPRLAIYKRFLKLWPAIPESDLKTIIQEVSQDRLARVLDLVENFGLPLNKLAERFLHANVSAAEIMMLDALTRFYRYLWPRYENIIKKLEDDSAITYEIEIDNKRFRFKVHLLFDGEPVKLDFYQRGHRKVVGVPRAALKCAERLREKLNNIIDELKTNPSTEKIEEIKHLLIDYEQTKNNLIEIDPKTCINFPPDLNRYKAYISEYRSPFACPYCGVNHVYTIILRW
jgi:hypothetical protein